MKIKSVFILLFTVACGGQNNLNFDSIEKKFVPFQGQRDNYPAVGNYDPEFYGSKENRDHIYFLELTVHLKDPAIDLPPGETGLPDEALTKHAQDCKTRVLSAMAKRGSVLYVGHYYWFNQFLIYTYLKEDQVNAITEELNIIMDEVPVTCHIATGLRVDKDREDMKFFQGK